MIAHTPMPKQINVCNILVGFSFENHFSAQSPERQNYTFNYLQMRRCGGWGVGGFGGIEFIAFWRDDVCILFSEYIYICMQCVNVYMERVYERMYLYAASIFGCRFFIARTVRATLNRKLAINDEDWWWLWLKYMRISKWVRCWVFAKGIYLYIWTDKYW